MCLGQHLVLKIFLSALFDYSLPPMASESRAERQVCFLLAVWSREQSPELKPQKLGFNSHSMACTTQPLVTEANTYALSQIGAITGLC